MADDDEKKKYPPLPSNYVSLAQLQERWLKQKQLKEEEEKQKEQQKAAEKQKQQQLLEQERENHCKSRRDRESVNLRKDQTFDRSGYIQRRPFERKNVNYKEKWKSKVENDVEKKGSNSCVGLNGNSGVNEGHHGKICGNSGGDGGGSVCTVEKEIPVVVSGKEGFRGGSKRIGGDGRSKFGVFANIGEGEDFEGRGRGEKKGRVAGLAIGNEKESSNGRGRAGYMWNQGKKGVMVEEEVCVNEGHVGKNWGKSGDNGGGGIRASMCTVEEEIHVVVRRKEGFRGGLERNGNGGRLKSGGFENVGEGKEFEEMGENLEGEKKEKDSALVIGNQHESSNERGRGGWGYRWNKGKKGMLVAKGRRDIKDTSLEEARNGNERAKTEVAKEGITGVGSGGNDEKDVYTSGLWSNGDDGGEKGEDVDEKVVNLEAEKEENVGKVVVNQDEGTRWRRKERNLGWKARVRETRMVIRDVERERASKIEAAEETLVVVNGNAGEKDGLSATLKKNGNDHMAMERKGLEESEGEMKGVKEREDEGLVMASQKNGGRIRFMSGYRRNFDKNGMARAMVNRDVERERARENAAAEETPVVVSENNGEKDGCTAGPKRNGDGQIEFGEMLENVMEGKGLQESEGKLGGEKETEDEELTMPSQRTVERIRFSSGYRWNREKRGVSGGRINKSFEHLSLNDGRKGERREWAVMNRQHRRYQKPSRFGGDSGVMWVKKGEISDANSTESRPYGSMMKAARQG